MEGLSFDNVPAIHIPFRFFNTAPWMGVFASLILIFGGADSFLSQWTPELLAITHLFTLGFMVMVMFGALFQLLPVISGEAIPKSGVVATFVHLSLTIGCILLVCGFLHQQYQFFVYALPVLLLAFASFLFALGSLLIHNIRGGESVFAIRLAAISLLFTVVLGLVRAASYQGYNELGFLPNITNLHLGWGLAGWLVLLVMGVSFQVIPMFHVTPNYPVKIAKLWPSVLFVLLLGISVVQSSLHSNVLVFLLAIFVLSYAVYSLWLLGKRKRKIRDLTVYFWRLALGCLAVLAVMLIGKLFIETGTSLYSKMTILIGVVTIYGFAVSVIMGMLQKIIPFLAYLHLQRQCMTNYELLPTLPNMREIISEQQSTWQFGLHSMALLLLVVSVAIPQVTPIAGVAALIDFLWLGVCVAKATKIYYGNSKRIFNSV